MRGGVVADAPWRNLVVLTDRSQAAAFAPTGHPRCDGFVGGEGAVVVSAPADDLVRHAVLLGDLGRRAPSASLLNPHPPAFAVVLVGHGGPA